MHTNKPDTACTAVAGLDCGGKQIATPLTEANGRTKSGVVAALRHRSPNFYPCSYVSIRGFKLYRGEILPMLTTLRIKNLALVSDLTLELRPGCNVITGETGAGKSIIIGALNLVLGERADRTLIGSGEESCSVEAVFDVLPAQDPRPESSSRKTGLSRARIISSSSSGTSPPTAPTGSSSTAHPPRWNVLAAIGEWLVDLHGPHDHQSLLHPARQLAILDAFGGLEKEREAFGELVRRRTASGS